MWREKMRLTTTLITQFFRLVAIRNYQAAKIVLVRIEKKLPRGEWNHGYFMALNGILLALQTKDPHAFVNNVTEADLPQCGREFMAHARNSLHADYDRGYFSAMAEYVKSVKLLCKRQRSTLPKQALIEPLLTEKAEIKSSMETV